jgi:hypothetical protein
VSECESGTLKRRKPWPTRGCWTIQKKKKIMYPLGTQPSLYNLTEKIRRVKKGKVYLNIEKTGIQI